MFDLSVFVSDFWPDGMSVTMPMSCESDAARMKNIMRRNAMSEKEVVGTSSSSERVLLRL